jgi:hypothetical protein
MVTLYKEEWMDKRVIREIEKFEKGLRKILARRPNCYCPPTKEAQKWWASIKPTWPDENKKGGKKKTKKK